MTGLYRALTRQNEAAQADAAKRGAATFQAATLDSWPACVECGTPIRHRPGNGHRDRSCACPGVQWRCGLDGWERR